MPLSLLGKEALYTADAPVTGLGKEALLGVRPEFDRLTVDPCIPAEWDGFTVVRRWRGAEYRIRVENPDHVEKGVKRIEVDGKPAERVPAFGEGKHDVRVIMG